MKRRLCWNRQGRLLIVTGRRGSEAGAWCWQAQQAQQAQRAVHGPPGVPGVRWGAPESSCFCETNLWASRQVRN